MTIRKLLPLIYILSFAPAKAECAFIDSLKWKLNGECGVAITKIPVYFHTAGLELRSSFSFSPYFGIGIRVEQKNNFLFDVNLSRFSKGANFIVTFNDSSTGSSRSRSEFTYNALAVKAGYQFGHNKKRFINILVGALINHTNQYDGVSFNLSLNKSKNYFSDTALVKNKAMIKFVISTELHRILKHGSLFVTTQYAFMGNFDCEYILKFGNNLNSYQQHLFSKGNFFSINIGFSYYLDHLRRKKSNPTSQLSYPTNN
ncbi:MAG: hypothetical protein IT235_01280 [Bacteroidia bacterium]|nr:hypothetical protein [Bacteroidia bacterium]